MLLSLLAALLHLGAVAVVLLLGSAGGTTLTRSVGS